MILDLIDLVTGLAYIALMLLGIYRTRRAASLPDVERGIRLFMLAALAEFINAATDLMQVDKDGWFSVWLSAFCLTTCVVTIHLTVKRADRMEGVQ